MQPAARAVFEIAEDGGDRGLRAEVDIRGLKSHGLQKARFVVIFGQRCEKNPRTIRREAAHEERTEEMQEWIGDANCASENVRIQNLFGFRAALRPDAGRRREGLRFSGNKTAAPGSQREDAQVAQAAEARDATLLHIGKIFFR